MSSISDIFGFHSKCISNKNVCLDETKCNYFWHNVTHIVGYIPILGIITGLFRIVQSRKEMEKDLPSDKQAGYAILQVRGVFEILGIGAIFLLPDLIVTAIRAGIAYQNRNNHFF